MLNAFKGFISTTKPLSAKTKSKKSSDCIAKKVFLILDDVCSKIYHNEFQENIPVSKPNCL